MKLQELQDAHKAWSHHNFGADIDPEWSLLGVIEETGELAHAVLKGHQKIRADQEAAAKDAVGDLVIFLTDYVSRMGWTYDDLYPSVPYLTFTRIQDLADPDRKPLPYVIRRLATLVGRLSEEHELASGFVKMGFRSHAYGRVRGILAWLGHFCAVKGWDFDAIVAETWAEVSKRDWVRYPETGLPS